MSPAEAAASNASTRTFIATPTRDEPSTQRARRAFLRPRLLPGLGPVLLERALEARLRLAGRQVAGLGLELERLLEVALPCMDARQGVEHVRVLPLRELHRLPGGAQGQLQVALLEPRLGVDELPGDPVQGHRVLGGDGLVDQLAPERGRAREIAGTQQAVELGLLEDLRERRVL